MANKSTFCKDLVDSNIEVSVKHIKQHFKFGHGSKAFITKAVDDISFDIQKGECFGLVGESGCGKTTTGRSLIRLYKITSGSIYFEGHRISGGKEWDESEIKRLKKEKKVELKNIKKQKVENKSDLIKEKKQEIKTKISEHKQEIKQIAYDNKHVDKKLMSKMQMIFQDPVDSLDPRMTVEDIIQEGLYIQGQKNRFSNSKKVADVLEKVGLIPEYASRYPHEFSGGQRQRIGIARALVMNPEFLICDEPISALDVSIRAQIINLLKDLKDEMGLTIMFIAHDLSVVKYFCDRIAVMYFGHIVELATSDELFKCPLHPYTNALLSAIPKPDPLSEKTRTRKIYNPEKDHDYSKEQPVLTEVAPGHWVLANSEELKKYKNKINKVRREEKRLAQLQPKSIVKPIEELKTTEQVSNSNVEIKESVEEPIVAECIVKSSLSEKDKEYYRKTIANLGLFNKKQVSDKKEEIKKIKTGEYLEQYYEKLEKEKDKSKYYDDLISNLGMFKKKK